MEVVAVAAIASSDSIINAADGDKTISKCFIDLSTILAPSFSKLIMLSYTSLQDLTGRKVELDKTNGQSGVGAAGTAALRVISGAAAATGSARICCLKGIENGDCSSSTLGEISKGSTWTESTVILQAGGIVEATAAAAAVPAGNCNAS